MVGVVGIVPGKSWLLRRLLFLRRILALVQYLLYVVWCTERTACPCALYGSVRRNSEFFAVSKNTLMSRWWMITSCKNVIERCRGMKEKADDLETFRKRFRRLCWLDGPNSLISMPYLRLFDVRWFLRTWCYVCVFCFPITISVTCSCVLEFYFEKRLTILFLVLGLVTWVVFAGWSWYWMVYIYREC